MDIATLIGLVLAFGLVIGSILVGGGLGAFIDVPSMLIVVFGTFAVGLVNYPLKDMISSASVAMNAFKDNVPDVKSQTQFLLQCADAARKDGVLALEKEIGNIDDAFMQKGLQMLVDGMDPEALKSMLYDELYAMDDRHRKGAKIFSSLASTAPAMGLIGTLIGLVQMLQNMSDPSAIGPAMAVALLTTFYGAVLANMIFTPISGKLSTRNNAEVLARSIVVKGVLGIAEGENPRVLGQRLMGEMAPGDRDLEG
ncbi:MAG: MotA/TolQ/ExbB proton channel family protein [Myxococcota bacterium]